MDSLSVGERADDIYWLRGAVAILARPANLEAAFVQVLLVHCGIAGGRRQG